MAVPPFVLDKSPIDAETAKIAEEELNETPENIKKGIAELRELLKNDPTIYFKDDDETLIIFLRPCKFYAKSAYELMKRIADFKEKNKDLLANILPTDEADAFTNHNVVNVLTNRDQKGRRVLLVNCGGSWDTSKVTSDQLFRLFYLIHIAAVLEPESQVKGVVVIMDFDKLSMKQIAALSPSFSMRLLGFIQDAMPLRLKEVHMVKQPFIFNMVWQIFKPFIRDKLKKRIFFHGSKMASLQKHLDKSVLPKDYDGDLPKIDYTGANWYPVIGDCMEFYKTWNTFGLVKK